MELLLLLLELQQEPVSGSRQVLASPIPIPVTGTFPLLFASVASYKTDISDPIRYLQGQAKDLLYSIRQMSRPPQVQDALGQMYVYYNLSQCLSACIYESLSDIERVPVPKGVNVSGYLLRRRKRTISASDDTEVITLPSKWPGVQNMVAVLSRSFDEDLPSLRLLLVEIFVAVYLGLFTYSFTCYDSRWLFRLAGHPINPHMFAEIFGGGGERKLVPLADDHQQQLPARPPPPARPPAPAAEREKEKSGISFDMLSSTVDPASLRAKFNARLFGAGGNSGTPSGVPASAKTPPNHSQTIMKWIPPKQSVAAYFMSKPPVRVQDELGLDYDSDNSYSEEESDDEDRLEEKVKQKEVPEHTDPHGYAWSILRLALLRQISHRIHQFLTISGVETSDPAALPVKRLWLFLVRQEHLMEIFIRYIFRKKMDAKRIQSEDKTGSGFSAALPEPLKIVQREQDPISSFAVSNSNVGWIVVSTGRELQEMDISAALQTRADWMHDTTELDIALAELKRNALVDNDDYLLVSEGDKRETAVLTGRGSSYVTPAIIDRSRKALIKLCKRQVHGIRRMDAHPSLPYYVTGANDGSVRLWEWGVAQPLYTPRVAGQFARVTKTRFSLHGNKFGITDADGCICLWQVSQSGVTLKKPYFSIKCHCKSAADFVFIGGASSLLATAGLGTGDNNLALWDTLQPTHKALIHSWPCHPEEGTLAIQYVANQQILISGGKNAELSFWDLRQRQLRHSCKAFEASTATVKSLAVDPAMEYLACGSSEGDLSIWGLGPVPQMLYCLPGEHSGGRTGLLRTSSGSVQLVFDGHGRLYSCGGDSLRLRMLP